MRIIAGKFRGREIKPPKGHQTHPMSERVRGALFNALGDITGMSVLDAYGGSGALALEALSRGAASVQILDTSRQALEAIASNIYVLGVSDSAKATHANCASWSERNLDKKFDLVLCDPPFDKVNLKTLEKLSRHLNENGLMVLSYTGRGSALTVNGVVVVDNRRYGDAALAFYRLAVD